MASEPPIDLASEVNAILNIAKRDLGLESDNALAKHLNVTHTAITKWRAGKLSPSSRALVPLLIQQHQIDVTKPRRRRKVVEVS